LARTEIDYKTPIYLRDEIFCYTKLESFGTKSFVLLSIIAKKTETGFVDCAYAKGILVCMDYKTGKSIEIPEDWRQSFALYDAQ
jgi:acyl-CoA thioesterase FadM